MVSVEPVSEKAVETYDEELRFIKGLPGSFIDNQKKRLKIYFYHFYF